MKKNISIRLTEKQLNWLKNKAESEEETITYIIKQCIKKSMEE